MIFSRRHSPNALLHLLVLLTTLDHWSLWDWWLPLLPSNIKLLSISCLWRRKLILRLCLSIWLSQFIYGLDTSWFRCYSESCIEPNIIQTNILNLSENLKFYNIPQIKTKYHQNPQVGTISPNSSFKRDIAMCLGIFSLILKICAVFKANEQYIIIVATLAHQYRFWPFIFFCVFTYKA